MKFFSCVLILSLSILLVQAGLHCDGVCELIPDFGDGNCMDVCECTLSPTSTCVSCCGSDNICLQSCTAICGGGTCETQPDCQGLCLTLDYLDGETPYTDCLDLCQCLYNDLKTCNQCCGSDQDCLDVCAVSCSVFDCEGLGSYTADSLSEYLSSSNSKSSKSTKNSSNNSSNSSKNSSKNSSSSDASIISVSLVVTAVAALLF